MLDAVNDDSTFLDSDYGGMTEYTEKVGANMSQACDKFFSAAFCTDSVQQLQAVENPNV